MVGIQFARSTVVNFTILGRVTANWDDERTQLAPQQQLLLARLIYAAGKRVEQRDLVSALTVDDAGLRRVVTELRTHLRDVMPVAHPIPNEGHGYRLVLDSQQADVFRFRAKRDAARAIPGAEGARLMREALNEWGPDASGLYGDCALTGLSGRWADETRFELGEEHRDAVVWCLQEEMHDDRHRDVLAECDQLGSSQERPVPTGHTPRAALLDEGFVELWIRAAYRCGQRDRAGRIEQRVLGAAGRLDKSAESKLRLLAERIRAEENPDGASLLAEPATAGRRQAESLPSAQQSAGRGDSGDTFHFHNAGAEIGTQIGAHHGPITNYAGSALRRPSGQRETTDPAKSDEDPGDDSA